MSEAPGSSPLASTIFILLKRAALVCGSYLLLAPVCAQDIRFENYTSEDGLPSNELNVLSESSSGYLWLGSKAGLTRFDGMNFKSILHERNDDLALPGRSVQYLLNDSKGRLWAGLEAGGLVEVDNQLNILRHLTVSTTPALLDDNIWSMAEDCSGKIWLGFAGAGGVALYDPEASTLQPVEMHTTDTLTETKLVTSLHVDANCQVWAGIFSGGLMAWDEAGEHFVRVASEAWPIADKSILAITSHGDNVYAADNDEIGVFNSLTREYLDKINIKQLADIDRVAIRSLSIAGDTLWAATGSGLYSILLSQPGSTPAAELDQLLAAGTFVSDYYVQRYQRQETLSGSLASNQLFFVTSDNNGNVWIASQDAGLVYKPPGWDNFDLLRRNLLADEYLPSNNINSVVVNGDKLWIGTYDAGPASYNYRERRLDTPATLKPPPFRRIWATHVDRSDNIWIAGVRRIVRYQPDQRLVELELPDTIAVKLRAIRPLGIVELRDSLWLVAKHRYLLRHELGTGEWDLRETDNAESGQTFMHYLPVDDQQFLFASESRLYRYHADTDGFEVLLDARQDHIQQMAFARDGQLWLAQRSGIVVYNIADRQLKPLLKLRYNNALRNTVINNMSFDQDGQLWLGTLNGLFKMLTNRAALTENMQPVFLHLTRGDGLPSSEMSENTLVRLLDGRMAIGTNQGMALFDPRSVKPQHAQPRVDINGLSSLDRDLTEELLKSQSLVFGHDDNTVSIRFNAVAFNNRDELIYQYRLDGWDEDWINTRQVPQVTYSRLEHGSYQFNARARVGSGEWGAINRSLSFSIQRPPWMTWWAYAIYGIVLLLSLALLQQRRQRARARRIALNQAQERQEFAETQTRIATDFARAIHYEEIASTMSATLKEALPVARMLVHFRQEQTTLHEYIYLPELSRMQLAPSDFKALYESFDSNPDMRTRLEQFPIPDQPDGSQLSLPLGAKRPVQAIACLQFTADKPPSENDIALASLVAQTAETSVHNTMLLEQVSQLAVLKQRANDAKSEFISTVSHEIRTPLHGLMGMLDLMNNCPSDTERQVLQQRLTDSSKQLLTVVDDVLDISKIEAHKVELSVDTFELTEVCGHVIRLFEDQAHAKELCLQALIAAGTCSWWLGDKTRLIQILTNLVNNAIKFTSHGGVFVTARETRQAPFGLELKVIDSGLGMSGEVLERLFDEYQQADDWTWKKYGGSGLGLSITKRLVELMGGTIAVSSKPGAGTQFSIFLPLDKPAILNLIKPVQWSSDFELLLACDQLNQVLAPLFDCHQQRLDNASQADLRPAATAERTQVLLTTLPELANRSPYPTALVYCGAEQPVSSANPLAQQFKLPEQWSQLLAWLLARSIKSGRS